MHILTTSLAIGRLVVDIIYGFYQGDVSVLDPVTTSQVNLASLLPIECYKEVAFHMRGLMNNDGTMGQLNTALQISETICNLTGVELKEKKDKMPVPEEVIHHLQNLSDK